MQWCLTLKKPLTRSPHKRLVDKLKSLPNVDPRIVNWIQDFLTNLNQRVAVKNAESTTLAVTSGVHQGSVLVFTLFLIYINDLSDCMNCNVSLYADDTLLYTPINNDTDRLLFQADIDSLHEWSSTNKMPFNTANCEVIAFNSRGSLPPSYKIGEHPLNYVDKIKYLGVVMQSNLKFNRHKVAKNTVQRKFSAQAY